MSSDAWSVGAGLAAGVMFIIVVALMTGSIQPPRAPVDLVLVADLLDETGAFLAKYPDADVIVYLRDIVEYYEVRDGKYASLRIFLDRDSGRATFFQITCRVIGDEYGGIEIHGSTMERQEIAEFLQDVRCPQGGRDLN